jgi:hypothetical protein
MIVAAILLIGSWALWKMPAAGLGRYDLLAGWSLKLLASLIFLWIYSGYYGWGTLTADPEAFLLQSTILRDVARESPVDYLRFLFGLEDQALIQKYLSQTFHWTAGDLTWINDSRNVIRVNSIIRFFSGGDALVHCVVLSFFSLIGFRELYLAFEKYVSHKRLFWTGLIAFPSLLFWTAGFLKEPMLIAGLCFFIRGVFGGLTLRKAVWRILFGALLLLGFKTYVLICILPMVVWYFASARLGTKLRLASLLLVPAIPLLILAAMPAQRGKMTDYLTRRQFDFINIGRGGLHAYADTCFFYFRPDQFKYLDVSHGADVYLKQPLVAKQMQTGHASPFRDVLLQPNEKPWYNYYQMTGCLSYVDITEINGSFSQLMRNVPEALVNAMLRPFPKDPGGGFKYIAVLETIALFAAFIFGLFRWKRLPRDLQFRLAALLGFALILFVLIGWTTPVLGAIVRYRIPAYLMIGLATLILLLRQRKQHGI